MGGNRRVISWMQVWNMDSIPSLGRRELRTELEALVWGFVATHFVHRRHFARLVFVSVLANKTLPFYVFDTGLRNLTSIPKGVHSSCYRLSSA